MVKLLTSFSIALIVFTVSIPAFSDDQQKAEKQLRKVTAMATDPTGRWAVNLTTAEIVGAKRSDLVMERRTMNLSYGDLFIFHELVKNGAGMDEIRAQLKAGKKITEIANTQHADWKHIAPEAKRLNAKMEENLYKHFLNGKADAARDAADGYDLTIDGVAADNDVSKGDIADAQYTYQLWQDRAEKARDSRLDSSTEKAARGERGDPVHGKADSLTHP